MAIDFTHLISRRLIPRDANYQPMSPVVGVNPNTGEFVPLSLKDAGDGTFELKVAITGVEIEEVDLGDVVIRATAPGAATIEARLTYHQFGAYDYGLKVKEPNLDTTLSTRASELTLNNFKNQRPTKTLAGNEPTDITIQTSKLGLSSPYVTTDLYGAAASFSLTGFKTKTFLILNIGAKAADVRIMGSIDNGSAYDLVVLDETTIPAGGSLAVKDSDYITDVVIQAKSKLVGNPTTVYAKFAAVPI